MTNNKPIGRIWLNQNSISGYVVVGDVCIKFAGTKSNPSLLFPAKAKDEAEAMEMKIEAAQCRADDILVEEGAD